MKLITLHSCWIIYFIVLLAFEILWHIIFGSEKDDLNGSSEFPILPIQSDKITVIKGNKNISIGMIIQYLILYNIHNFFWTFISCIHSSFLNLYWELKDLRHLDYVHFLYIYVHNFKICSNFICWYLWLSWCQIIELIYSRIVSWKMVLKQIVLRCMFV